MNIRNAHSPLARAFAGAALAASVMTAAGSASAVTCTPDFPITNYICQSGTTRASVLHWLGFEVGGTTKYYLSVDMEGGSKVAVAYGIDVNGVHLNQCATTGADDDARVRKQSSVPCSELYGTSGTADPNPDYEYPTNMRSTFIVVL